jgi:hypothetical protein
MAETKKATPAKRAARKPRAKRVSGGSYYKARHAFGVQYKGEFITIAADELVPAGHALLKQLGSKAVEEHFEPVTSFGRWDKVEQATAAPGEKRGA